MELKQIENIFKDSDRKFTVLEAIAFINQIDELRVEIDTQCRFHGSYFYEIVPLITIANSLKNQISSIQFVADSERFDGVFWMVNGNAQKIEMTAAIDGQNDALQMELLAIRGHAPAYQQINSSGPKRHRVFGKNKLMAYSGQEYVKDILYPMILERITKKCIKAEANDDYKKAWLGVVFDDYFAPREDRKPRYLNEMCKNALLSQKKQECPFTRIFFVGVSGKYVFDSAGLIE